MDTDSENGNYLSDSQIAQYWDEGYLFPVSVFSAEEAASYRSELERIEQEWGASKKLPRPLANYKRVHSEIIMPLASRMALSPKVLDAVEGILGPNIMIWGAEFFIKEAHSKHIVTMHQDLTYWGFGETSDQVTAWIALSPSTVSSGCMDLVGGSHKKSLQAHNDTMAENNLLSRGQEIAVEVTEQEKTHVELQPGEMSLHHGQCIHGSGTNTSDDRRIGFAVRYINTNIRQQSLKREYAMLARGVDRTDSFTHFAAPTRLFDPAALALYEEIRTEQTKVLAAGIKSKKALYGENRAF
jgi:hypothetical protein